MTQIGWIQETTIQLTGDSACTKCGGVGHLQSFTALPDGGICYRCDGLGVSAKDYKVVEVETTNTNPLNVTFMDDFPSFEALLANRQAKADHLAQQVAKFEQTGNLVDLFS